MKKELKYIKLLTKKKKKTQHMKFYNFFLRVFIFWNSSLSIVNVDKYKIKFV